MRISDWSSDVCSSDLWIGFPPFAVAAFCLTYVFSQGSRWDWFEEPRILWLTAIGTAGLLAFVARQLLTDGRGQLDFTLFMCADFSFAFIVSFVAGAALFGSRSEERRVGKERVSKCRSRGSP